MKSVSNLRLWALGVALMGSVAGSSAVTLGRVRSVVLLGQPLELTVPVQFGADEDASAPCFDADVFYGDIQLERSRVTVSTIPSAQVQSATVRVRAQGGVDEPVVTVYFRAGCDHKTTRRYVLLADLATDVDVPVVASSTAARPPPVPALPVPVGTLAPIQKTPSHVTVSSPKSAKAGPSTPAPKVERPPSPAVIAEPVSRQHVTSSKTRERARLRLAPLDMRVERDPVLKSSDVLMDVPIEDLQKRAQVVATWRALNASPEEVLQQDARMRSMDGDLKSLMDLTVKNQQALVYFAGRLEQAEAQRYSNPLVYGLVFGLLACIGGIAYLLGRLGRGHLNTTPWWRGQSTAAPSEERTPDVRPPVKHEARIQSDVDLGQSAPPPPLSMRHDPFADDEGVDIDLDVRESAFTRLVSAEAQVASAPNATASPPAKPVAAGQRDFSHSVTATLRAINTQEMLDVRQQAEFFMTLGQHEEAIALLEESINGSNESNPLVYLDLLKVLHTLSRKIEYDQYRNEFNALFSGRVPPYTHFSLEGHGLDDYNDVCQHLATLWPSEAALNFLEQCLVRSQDDWAQEFDLLAFRDLLTLHGVLRRLLSSNDSGFVPFSTSRSLATSRNEPSSIAEATSPFAPNDTMPVMASVDTNIGVDMDLSEPDSNLLEFDEIDLSLEPANPKIIR